MKDNVYKFLNRVLYSLYNLMYFSGLLYMQQLNYWCNDRCIVCPSGRGD